MLQFWSGPSLFTIQTKSLSGEYFLSFDNILDFLDDHDQIKHRLEDCVHIRVGDISAEVEVAIVSFQDTLAGMSPYFVICGNPQSKNESNDFPKEIIACL